MTFEELVATAEAGEEISSASQRGSDNDEWLAIWYDAGDAGEIMVTYDRDTGNATSAQVCGTREVLYAS